MMPWSWFLVSAGSLVVYLGGLVYLGWLMARRWLMTLVRGPWSVVRW